MGAMAPKEFHVKHKYLAALAAAAIAIAAAFPAAAGTPPPAIPRPTPPLPMLETAEFVSALESYRAADESNCYSQPGDLVDELEIVSYLVQAERWDGSRAYTVRNPGPAGVGVVVTDLMGMTASLRGTKLYRDDPMNTTLVAVWLNEDFGVYTVHGPVTFPKGTSGFMIRLDSPLDHATFTFWGDPSRPQDCAAGVARAQTRQGMPAAITATSPISITRSGAITTTGVITAPLSVTQFHAAMATATAAGVDWLDVADFVSEMNGGAYRVSNVGGDFNLKAGTCLVVWGSIPRDYKALSLKVGAGWRAQMWCATDAVVDVVLPSSHSGVVLNQDPTP